MSDINKCMFTGRLGKDPDMRMTSEGTQIANLSLAVSWRTKGKEGTEWVRVSFFGTPAEICSKYLKKGSRVAVVGRMSTRKWQDQSGNDRYTTEIAGQEMTMLDSRQNSESSPSDAAKDNFEDYLPF